MVESNSTSFETLAFQANAVNWVAGELVPLPPSSVLGANF